MQKLMLEGELTIYSAAETKTQLLTFLDSADELEINLAEVSEIDTAGLQLLILAKQEAKQAGKKLHFSLHSTAVLELLELANLVALFGDPIVLSH